jgi:DNA gyrase/topoisomerase IV subunit A
MIKRTLVKDLGISKLTKITKVMKLSNDDKVVSCLITSDQNANVGVVSELGKIIIYPSDQISIIGKDGSGVKNTNLEDENIASIFLNNTSKDYLLIVSKQGMKRIKKETLPLGNRTNSPKSFVSQVKNNPIIIKNAFEINQNDMINCLEENGK